MTPRTLVMVRLGYGLLQLSAPNLVPTRILGRPLRPRELGVVRLLGARHLLQAAVTAAAPTPAVLRLGAGVDAAHATSMIVAAGDRRRRRAAVTEMLCAAALAALGLRIRVPADGRSLSGRGATTS